MVVLIDKSEHRAWVSAECLLEPRQGTGHEAWNSHLLVLPRRILLEYSQLDFAKDRPVEKRTDDWLVALRDMGTCKAFRATDGLLEGREMQQIHGRAGVLEHLLTVMVGAHPQARLAGVLRSMAGHIGGPPSLTHDVQDFTGPQKCLPWMRGLPVAQTGSVARTKKSQGEETDWGPFLL